jgi:hypothetical protein
MCGMNIMDEENFVEVMPSEIKKKDVRLEKMDADFLPELPATFLILGCCGSGKSSILWSMISKGYVTGDKKKKSVFDEALIYLGTLDAKPSFEKMPIENKLILTEFEPISFNEYQDDLKAHQLERLDKGKSMLNSCIIFDDFAGANLMKKSKVGDAPPIQKLCLTSRHESNASIFYLSQFYKATGFTSPGVRANVTTLIVSKMPRNEIRKIAEEYSEDYEPDEWVDIYDKYMATKPYVFVVWDRRRPMNAGRWTFGFTNPFPPSAKMLGFNKAKTMEMRREESSDSE